MMFKKIAVAILVFAVFGVVLALAGKADYGNCMAAGKKLGAKAVAVGNKCMIEGYGRL